MPFHFLAKGLELSRSRCGKPVCGELLILAEISNSPHTGRRRCGITLEGRRRLSLAMKKRWADSATSPVALAMTAFYISRKSRERRAESWRSRVDACVVV